MLFDCHQIDEIWSNISKAINMPVNWKEIVCGYPKYQSSSIIIICYNYIVSIVAYIIFRINSKCKFECLNYANIDIYQKVRASFVYFDHLLKCVKHEITWCVINKKMR